MNLKSKKLLVLVITVIVTILGSQIGLEEASINDIIQVVSIYLVGQSAVDFSKSWK